MTLIDDILAREAAPHRLPLQIHGLSLVLRGNDAGVVESMRRVYSHYVSDSPSDKIYEIWALELDPTPYVPADLSGFERFVVTSGKAKEQFRDDGDTRLVKKLSTGVWIVFDDRRYIIMGPVTEAFSQLNNIVNAIHMKEMRERGYVVLHAAGLELDGSGFALAGRAGAGKTTTLLKLVEAGGVFVSNDRLLVRRDDGGFEMRGVAKWPRVCGGTMYGDPRLRRQLSPEVAARYGAMGFDELFAVEDKYDVDIAETYGPGQVADVTRLRRVYCLMWSRDGVGFAIDHVDGGSKAFWDEYGPSLSRDTGVFDRHQRTSRWSPEKQAVYEKALAGLDVYIITGKLDFDRAARTLQDHLRSS